MGSGLSIEMGHDSLYESNLRELEGLLTRVKMQDKELTEVDLSNRFLGFGGARVAAEPLARARNLQRLNLSYNNLGGVPQKKKYGRPRPQKEAHEKEEIGMPYIADALARNTSLVYLNLSGNNLCASGLHCVSQMLRKNKQLEELVLFNNNIGDDSMPDFCDALAYNNTLYKVNLDYNHITDNGAERIFRMLDTNQTLTDVTLKENEGISETWMRQIAQKLERNREVQDREREAREAQERADRLAAEEAEKVRQEKERELREERERIEREYEELEARKRAEEEEQNRIYQQEEERRELKRQAREARIIAQEEHIESLVNLAYAWRETLRGGERRGREWRSGFETHRDTSYSIKDSFMPPQGYAVKRRLVACWCEPTEQTVAYPGQLHYHCIHEPSTGDPHYLGEADHVTKYEGCMQTGHRCRSAPMSYNPERNQGSLFAADSYA
mmetsp:Transcript_142334/g.248202  ORF Transcript_142334/g.248202 Transcript_142334/m.248202 type:complete len:444 (-) Transcript_142334:597-1928(-)